MTRRTIVLAIAALAAMPAAQAHESRPAYLELRQIAEDAYDATWKVPARGNDLRLGLYVTLPEGCEDTGERVAAMRGDAFVERWSFRRPQGLIGETVRIDGLASTMTDVLVRVQRMDGTTQVERLLPAQPFFVVDAAPSGWRVVKAYFSLGIEHILLGVDHLLFVLGLLLIVDRRWRLVKTITAFTVAHSITLALAAFSVVRVPEEPLNASIALSILFLGPEIIRKRRGETSFTIRSPWLVAFAFGLLHGIGFASGLSLTGVPDSEIPSALLFFNLGVEAGQLAFVAVALVVVRAIQTLELDRPRWVTGVPAYAVGTLGAYWTVQRVLMMIAPLPFEALR